MGGGENMRIKRKILNKINSYYFCVFYFVINLLLVAISTFAVKENSGYLLIYIQKVLK